MLCRLPLLGFFTIVPSAPPPGSWGRGRRVLAADGSGHHGCVRCHPHGGSVRLRGIRYADRLLGSINRFFRRLLNRAGLFAPLLGRGGGVAAATLGRTVARRLLHSPIRAERYIRRPLTDALFLASSHVLLHQTVPAQLLHRFCPGLEPLTAHSAASGGLCSFSGAGAGRAAASAFFSANA